MSVTGRIAPRKAPHKGATDKFLATHSGSQIARQARVEELRQLVAEGRYEVDVDMLAQAILKRALRVREDE